MGEGGRLRQFLREQIDNGENEKHNGTLSTRDATDVPSAKSIIRQLCRLFIDYSTALTNPVK